MPQYNNQATRNRRGIKQFLGPVRYRLRRLSRRVFGIPRYSVLFVCTGNTCRSALAEGIARELYPEWRVASAGTSTGASRGNAAAAHAIDICPSLASHRSSNLLAHNLWDYDTVVVLNNVHLDSLRDHPDHREVGLSDPYGGTLERYEDTAHQIREMLAGLYDGLQSRGY